MTLGIGNLWMLVALVALAIPVILHLLQRRRFDTLDWGAMQFLPDSVASQRRRWLDELLLMLLRMGMIAILVLALATPFTTSAWLGSLQDGAARDVVLILDGSYSMDARRPNQATAWEDAVRWARKRVAKASRGERFAVLIARKAPRWWQAEFHADVDFEALPAPRGNADMPLALAEAWNHLRTSGQAQSREIVVLTDRQQYGWADPASLAALDSLAEQWHADRDTARRDGTALPALRVISVGPNYARAENYALAPLAGSRGMAKLGQKVVFQTALHLDGFAKYVPPRGLTVSVDGVAISAPPLPDRVELKTGQVPLSFQHRFDREGTHVVSVKLDVDPAHDVLAADNEQYAVVEVVKDLPVLLVDGDADKGQDASSYFLQRALTAGKQAPPVIDAAQLRSLPANKPAVIVLADVPKMTAGQGEVLERFVAEGGGVLVVVGDRMVKNRASWNEQAYHGGHGWLPARLGEVGTARDGVQPEPRSFQHPALEILRSTADGALGEIRFTQWCKVEFEARDRALAIALLSNGEPFLIEKPYKKGRVMLCAVPLDRRWGSTLPSTWQFPILVHELMYSLAGSRTASALLEDGAPIRIASLPAPTLAITTPEDGEKIVDVKSWPWTYANTGAIGLYRIAPRAPAVARSDGMQRWFVVAPDSGESNLARCTENDWAKVRGRLPVRWLAEGEESSSLHAGESRRQDLWWLLMLAVLALLCAEVWMTRRLVRGGGR